MLRALKAAHAHRYALIVGTLAIFCTAALRKTLNYNPTNEGWSDWLAYVIFWAGAAAIAYGCLIYLVTHRAPPAPTGAPARSRRIYQRHHPEPILVLVSRRHKA